MNSSFKIGKLKLKKNIAKAAECKVKLQRYAKDNSVDEEETIKIKDQVIEYAPTKGKGLVVTSGNSLLGEGTKFEEEIEKGDFIILFDDIAQINEEKRVLAVLGNNSILLEYSFQNDRSDFTEYYIKKKNKVIIGENLTNTYREKTAEAVKTKMIKKAEMNVRLKKGHWSYQEKKVEVEAELSREQLLNLREKMIKDKFCW